MANDNNGARDVLSLLVGLILGTLIGGVIALLLAPKSGEELRGDISSAAQKARERAEHLKAQMAEKYETLRAQVEEHIKSHHAGEAPEELAEDVEANLEEA